MPRENEITWKTFVRFLLRVSALPLAGLVVFEIGMVMRFPIEGESELREVEQYDLGLGGVLALALILLFGPSSLRA